MKTFATFICIIFSLQSFSQIITRREYSALPAEGAEIKIDGLLDEEAWQNANWESEFIQVIPYEGRAPYYQTKFAILYDHKNIYAAFIAYDNNPDSISLRMARRDHAEGDAVNITFDTYHDKRTGFNFSVSAAGIKSDLIFSDDAAVKDDTWDPIWHVKTRVNKEGWIAEMEIPLTQLRFEEGEEQEWGMQVGRYIFRKDESSQWQPIKRDEAGYISKFGNLKGIKNITPKKTLDFTPYSVARLETFEKDPANPFRSGGKEQSIKAGLDAKIGLTNYLTMDFTVNPDFGQVEADPSRVNLSAFETFYEEKRPFFVEGKNILKYQLMFGDNEWTTDGLFYSRRIGRQPQVVLSSDSVQYAEVPEFTRILGAAKITGKSKKGWSIGVLETLTSKEMGQIINNSSRQQRAVEPLTNYFVTRVQKDFNNNNSYFGGIVTAVNRNLDESQLLYLHKSAFSAGIDWMHKWKQRAWNFEGGLYMSRVDGSKDAITRTQLSWIHNFARPDANHLEYNPERTALMGHGGKLNVSKIGGKLKFGSQLYWKSPGLELNDIGFAQQVDHIQQVFWSNYQIYEPFSIFRSVTFNISEYAIWDFDGNKNLLGFNTTGNAQLVNYWNINANYVRNGEQLFSSSLRGGPALRSPGSQSIEINLLTNPQKSLTFQLNSGVLFSHEKNYNKNQNISLNIGYRPFKSLRFDVTPGVYFAETELQYITQTNYNNSKRYIFGRIEQNIFNMSIRMNYNLNPDLTIQYWGQPFIASGAYSNFKHITDSKAELTADRYHIYEPRQLFFDSMKNEFAVDENADGTSDYFFSKPDFNVSTFLSNLVLRWEYRPGSVAYLVWSQNKNAYNGAGRFDFEESIKKLLDTQGTQIFLLKLSYRIGR